MWRTGAWQSRRRSPPSPIAGERLTPSQFAAMLAAVGWCRIVPLSSALTVSAVRLVRPVDDPCRRVCIHAPRDCAIFEAAPTGCGQHSFNALQISSDGRGLAESAGVGGQPGGRYPVGMVARAGGSPVRVPCRGDAALRAAAGRWYEAAPERSLVVFSGVTLLVRHLRSSGHGRRGATQGL